MSDIGPRRTLDLRQPQTGQPQQPAPQPAPQPVAPAPRPVQPAPTPVQPQPESQTPAPQPNPGKAPKPPKPPKAPKEPRKRGAFMVVLQFIVGALIIVAVAAAIVALYTHFYS